MRVLLVDGTNIVRRYAFAILREAQAAPKEEHIETVIGAVSLALLDCAALTEGRHAVLGFDSPEPTWRHEIFPTYKANRPPSGLDWSGVAGTMLGATGWRSLRAPGFEADDILATLAARLVNAGHGAAVLSSDSDLLQLSGDAISVYQFGKKGEPRFAARTGEWICQKYGIPFPDQLTLCKAMVGEPGDNLPGVAGAGPAKARKVLALYRTAEEIMRSGTFCRENREQLALMLKLVTLREDVPLPLINSAGCRIPERG